MRYAGSIHNRFFCKWPYSLLSQISLSKIYTGTGAESFRNPNTNKFLSDPPDCRIYSLTVWYWGDDEIHRVLDYFQWNDHVLLKRCILFFYIAVAIFTWQCGEVIRSVGKKIKVLFWKTQKAKCQPGSRGRGSFWSRYRRRVLVFTTQNANGLVDSVMCYSKGGPFLQRHTCLHGLIKYCHPERYRVSTEITFTEQKCYLDNYESMRSFLCVTI